MICLLQPFATAARSLSYGKSVAGQVGRTTRQNKMAEKEGSTATSGEIGEDGWLTPVRRVPSPNHGARPAGSEISLLVIHNISLPPGCFGGPHIERFFCNQLDSGEHPSFAEIKTLEVSAHLLIDRRGQLTQFVPFSRRAWHAGVSSFAGRGDCNDYSIGIELEGTDDVVYTDVQYRVLAQVTQTLLAAYPGLTKDRIVGHCDIAPGRKTDPGGSFDWPRYLAGL